MRLYAHATELLAESRESDFRQAYRHLGQTVLDEIVKGDPSKSKKYLRFMGRIMSDEPDTDVTDLVELVRRFDKMNLGKDITSVRDVAELTKMVGTTTRIEKRTKLENVIYEDEDWKVMAPESHEAMMHVGGGTRWCIATSNEDYWEKYYYRDENTIVVLKNKHSGARWCLVGNQLDYATLYDSNDHTVDLDSVFDEGDDDTEMPEEMYSAISEYFDRNEYCGRRDEWIDQKLAEKWEESGPRDVLDDLVTLLKTQTHADVESEDVRDAISRLLPEERTVDELLAALWWAAASYYRDRGDGEFDSSGSVEWPGLPETWSGFEKIERGDYGDITWFDFNALAGFFYDNEDILNAIRQRVRDYAALERRFDIEQCVDSAVDRWVRMKNDAMKGDEADDGFAVHSEPHNSYRFTTLDDVLRILREAGFDDLADAIAADRIYESVAVALRRLLDTV